VVIAVATKKSVEKETAERQIAPGLHEVAPQEDVRQQAGR
jgi:hypothetical protein